MITRIVEGRCGKIAICNSEHVIILDGQSALDFIASIGYEHRCHNIAINKAAICEEFFNLSTGVAGEVAQKFVNYNICFAIIGDFSSYASKPLRDFIYESNKRGPLYFAADEHDAMQLMGGREVKVYEFGAIIQKVLNQDAAYVAVPFDIKEEFGVGRMKVHATFDGEPYDGSIVNMGVKNVDGSVCYIIGVRKDIRAKIGKQAGDKIKVTISPR